MIGFVKICVQICLVHLCRIMLFRVWCTHAQLYSSRNPHVRQHGTHNHVRLRNIPRLWRREAIVCRSILQWWWQWWTLLGYMSFVHIFPCITCCQIAQHCEDMQIPTRSVKSHRKISRHSSRTFGRFGAYTFFFACVRMCECVCVFFFTLHVHVRHWHSISNSYFKRVPFSRPRNVVS